MGKFYSTIIVSLLSLFLAGCVTVLRPYAHDCAVEGDNTLVLIGPVDRDLQTCAARYLTNEITTVVVSSFGGDTAVGRTIGDMIANRPRRLIVRGECLSSCANYFVPTAQIVRLEDGAIIALHGTLDPYTANKHRLDLLAGLEDDYAKGGISREEYDRILIAFSDQNERQFKEEDRFASKHGVPLGWRLYRDIGDADYSQHFDGNWGYATHENMKMIAAEAPLLRSCLPHVVFENEATTRDIVTIASERLKEAKALRLQFSGEVKCRPNTGQRYDPRNAPRR